MSLPIVTACLGSGVSRVERGRRFKRRPGELKSQANQCPWKWLSDATRPAVQTTPRYFLCGTANARPSLTFFSPAWLEEWLDGGARPHRIECCSAGPTGYENRCPQVGDVWELLELLLEWWAERVCAVAAGFPMWSGQAAGEMAAAGGTAGTARGAGSGGGGRGGVGTTGRQQQQRGGGGGQQGENGMGSLAGNAAATTQAVEAVQVNIATISGVRARFHEHRTRNVLPAVRPFPPRPISAVLVRSLGLVGKPSATTTGGLRLPFHSSPSTAHRLNVATCNASVQH